MTSNHVTMAKTGRQEESKRNKGNGELGRSGLIVEEAAEGAAHVLRVDEERVVSLDYR